MIGPVSASIAMAAISLAPRSAAGTPGCLAEPGAIAAAFEESWNRHDMEEFASLFWEDASFVARGGRLSIGRESIKAAHAALHAAHLQNSRLSNRLERLHMLGGDVAIALVRSDLSGSERGGKDPVRTRLTMTLQRRECGWRIAAAQNTTLAAATD